MNNQTGKKEQIMAVATRTNAQTSRQGWRPSQSSDARLASDIVASIRAHAEFGMVRSAWDYCDRLEIMERVETLLGR
jgi:hypothetical protein